MVITLGTSTATSSSFPPDFRDGLEDTDAARFMLENAPTVSGSEVLVMMVLGN